MFFGSAQWFYATAAWFERCRDFLLQVGNEIDERTGVLQPEEPQEPEACDCMSPFLCLKSDDSLADGFYCRRESRLLPREPSAEADSLTPQNDCLCSSKGAYRGCPIHGDYA